MKKLTILLFGAMFFALITGYIESVSADHDEDSGGIFHRHYCCHAHALPLIVFVSNGCVSAGAEIAPRKVSFAAAGGR